MAVAPPGQKWVAPYYPVRRRRTQATGAAPRIPLIAGRARDRTKNRRRVVARSPDRATGPDRRSPTPRRGEASKTETCGRPSGTVRRPCHNTSVVAAPGIAQKIASGLLGRRRGRPEQRAVERAAAEEQLLQRVID